MEYGKILPGIFQARPNRFIALVEIEGRVEVCHVKNTGRCRELLLPGVTVWLEESKNPTRKTKYDLIAVEKLRPGGPLLINMDSQAPNKVFGEWAAAGGLGFVPTLRGVKHLEELVSARGAGYEAGVCFLVQMAEMSYVEPNDGTHPEFGAALRRAARAGVEVLALECAVEPGKLTVKGTLPVRL